MLPSKPFMLIILVLRIMSDIMKDETLLKTVITTGIVLLEAIALLKGINGIYFATVMGILGTSLGVKYNEKISKVVKKITDKVV